MPKQKLIAIARNKLKETHADLIVANDIGSEYQKNPNQNNVILVDLQKELVSGWKNKEEIARIIRHEIEQRFVKFF
jgi:phosphopantothenoylcysteine decarboxylase/phosphopantothenate--cysteine ligase